MISLQADLAEGAGTEGELIPHLDGASLCCGVHAGSATETIAVARMCHQAGLEVGAHPGYDDRESFGREETGIGADEIAALLRFQVASLAAVVPVAFLKVHGALYHRCQSDPDAADAAAEVAALFELGVVGQPGFELLAAARRAGIPAYREAFADRAYLADGRLARRGQPGAVLGPEAAAEQAVRFARSGDFDCICIHGDSPGAARTASLVRAALAAAGVETGPLAE